MSIIKELENKQIQEMQKLRAVPEFRPGDNVRVGVKVIEGEKERVQFFEGVCVARRMAGINSSFTLRKISYGEGVERLFPLYSPRLTEITVTRRGDVRRAKLFYLRGLTGKAARITEKMQFNDNTAAVAAAEKTE